MERSSTMTVEEAAKLLNIHPTTIRYMLEQKLVDWGMCIKLKRNIYVIYRDKFEQVTGIKTN